MKDELYDVADVTRLEVITDKGRLITMYGVTVELSVQDGGRTLKVFAKPALPTITPHVTQRKYP